MAEDALATKGYEVEEWVDLRFFRPIGMWIVRMLAPTRVSPDQVTLWCLIVGLLGGHCFMYASPWINAAGFVLLVVSDILDSADGQLARLRGTSTPFGRILDGTSDTLRFACLYGHVIVRLVLHAGWGIPAAMALAVIAAVSHSWQSAAVDCVRHAFLELGVGRGSELDLPEDLEPARPGESWPARVARSGYRAYVKRQLWICPATVELVRTARLHPEMGTRLRAEYRTRQAGVVRQCAWLGQNIRWVLVGIPCTIGRPALFLWATVVPLNVVLVLLLATHERRSASLLAAVPDASARDVAALGSGARGY